MPGVAMADPFPAVLAETLRFEGGYSNRPGDRGGATDYGVTQATYDAYRVKHGKPKQGVKGISRAEVTDVYRSEYWLPAGCDKLPPAVAAAVFDWAVNSGVSEAALGLHRAKAALPGGDAHAVAAKICDEREAFLQAIAKHPKQAQFLKGWLDRVRLLRAFCARLPVS